MSLFKNACLLATVTCLAGPSIVRAEKAQERLEASKVIEEVMSVPEREYPGSYWRMHTAWSLSPALKRLPSESAVSTDVDS